MIKYFIFLLLFILLTHPVFAQPDFVTTVYPPQHGLNIPADAELHVALQKALDPASITDSSIYIYSDITGLHKWDYSLKNDNKELNLQPRHWWGVGDEPFNAGERVTVTLTTRLRYADGSPFEGFTWHYTVAVRQNYGGNFTSVATFGGPYHWLCFDANGDRFPDVILEDRTYDKLAIFLNDGKGKLYFSHHSPMSIGSFDQTIDFDRNGGIDINMGKNLIQFNDGSGNFTEKEILPNQTIRDKLYDFNNDGIIDLVTGTAKGHQWTPELFIMRSKSYIAYIDTHRISKLPFVPEFYQAGESYDLNNDGSVDFVITGRSNDSPVYYGFLSILMKNNELPIVFQLQQINFLTNKWFYGNDLNGDGYIDYVFSGNAALNDTSLHLTLIYLNNGIGNLELEYAPIDKGSYSTGGDIDGDGDIDFFLTKSTLINAMPYTVVNDYALGFNLGKGEFDWSESMPLLGTDSGYGYPILVDLDLDGDLDVLLSGPPGVQMVIANEEYATSVNVLTSKQSEASEFEIHNFPNPFNAYTIIQIKRQNKILEQSSVCIYDICGRLVKQWNLTNSQESLLQIKWSGKDEGNNQLPSGIYILNVKLGNKIKNKKIILTK